MVPAEPDHKPIEPSQPADSNSSDKKKEEEEQAAAFVRRMMRGISGDAFRSTD
eukprot:CAMPEP_0198708770 /NCGR_PEP_ID=MMETSP1471-20131121/1322_1 /TAXON_ID=41880 /ORGANISM="Pycnococcus provasolii, Strain RCC733" /LENGTH=52 /DNA_ID=CAMNT_0044468057 /DNA_START=682 /DNA_END=840 /DNA_ORIENTATION=+